MEDSFRVRAEKAFGSLPIPCSSSSSLWSLTDDEIKTTPSTTTRTRKPEPEQPKPYFFSSAAASSSSGFGAELEDELQDLDDDVDDDEDKPVRREPTKPSDYDDEQWEIRSGIGLDSTLDFEEEEDQYDKQAVGNENSGDRVYMKDITDDRVEISPCDRVYMRDMTDDGVEISSCGVLPTKFREFERDLRANHMAARIRLKQDEEATKGIGALHVSEKSPPDISGGGGGDAVNPKSILKSRENPSEPKPQKRVRFDSECDGKGDDEENEGTRDVRRKTTSMEEEEVEALNQPSKAQEFASAVPDYIRNPSRYTHYTFDSASDMDDKANKEAYMGFLAQMKGTGSQADDALDDLPSVTFISKKKSSDVTMVENEMVSRQKLDVGKESMNKKAFPVSIAAAGDNENSDVCAMEEDEPEVMEDAKKSSQRLNNRKYRKKPQELEEHVV
uniref:U5 small nuclear ribonucleoprotein TSSC4 n=1 Tax=Lotus japonicus TaxID=34305 RepID=I3S7N6_LOTJA|nr:unknown [Lotus japonicus]